MQERSVFKNIVKMTKDSGYQLKFKLKGAEYQPYAPSISDAISFRNKYYISENYRPNHLYKKFLHLIVLLHQNASKSQETLLFVGRYTREY